MEQVKRIYVEKKSGFDIPAQALLGDLVESLGLEKLTNVRLINRYDIQGINEAEYAQARNIVFSEPNVDIVYDEILPLAETDNVFAIEYLPGQYDQTADSAAQCVQLLTQKERPVILSAKVIVLEGDLTAAEVQAVKEYCINAVESREADLDKPQTLSLENIVPAAVKVLEGFNEKDETALAEFMNELGLAMSFEDLKFCQAYFRDHEKRQPTITEIKLIDTYWSDHCRHTTFLTELEAVEIGEGYFAAPIVKAYEDYKKARAEVYGDKKRDICLMDIAVIGMKQLRKMGKLTDLDESEEINACSIVVNADIDGVNEEWLVMFKNETHNHPTEIEPFGGAATCLGGAIRDPLSGRSYVYQAMRVTGSADPRGAIKDTIPGKLPQKKITVGAAAGYSSYGNQIGLATGQVAEVYHEDYVAKRMEIGAVIAAAPKCNVVREVPKAGDVVILVGGRTGRDGCGGATGSSKEHTEESLFSCGAEVQKGNPPTERKIQRLFRNKNVSTMIKRCNDFGAGGVSVAIGELTDALEINLDAVPKKYDGLDGTELAISESQERMAVVVEADNAQAFIDYASAENLEAVIVAEVKDDNRLKMNWRNQQIVNLSREFLNTNGVKQTVSVKVELPNQDENYFKQSFVNAADLKQAWLDNLGSLNVCSQKGLVERFDSTIGAGTVLMPFGGKYQATPSEGMVAKLPLLQGDTDTATAMTYGFNPYLSKWSPFHGALYAIVEAVSKIVAVGGKYDSIRLTLQEYFEKLGTDEVKWGKPFSALLGALKAQQEFGIPAIGGKDSMSGTFKDINVPPSLIAFAVDVVSAKNTISAEFKQAGNKVIVVPAVIDKFDLPDFAVLRNNFAKVSALIKTGKVLAASSVRTGGIAAVISKMSFGNQIGFSFAEAVTADHFKPDYGTLVLEVNADVSAELAGTGYYELGSTIDNKTIIANNFEVSLTEAQAAFENTLEKIFPTKTKVDNNEIPTVAYNKGNVIKAQANYAKPRIFIPVFPGTNCEYDTAKAFELAGGTAETLVIRNLTATAVEESVQAIVKGIEQAQILMLPGGFSAGDEPDGSGKFIAAMFRNPRIKEAVQRLLQQRDGLMLGICNGFQALIKLGLVPYGEITDIKADSPTLTHNKIDRHISCMVQTKVVSNLSPWFNNVKVGDVHSIAMSHGEGRFVADEKMLEQLMANGQIATQYVDHNGQASLNIPFNPNGSTWGIEGITSPDGRVLGKMGHSERIGTNVAKNIVGAKDQQIFAAGVNYYK